jgi:hypothetical protein
MAKNTDFIFQLQETAFEPIDKNTKGIVQFGS